MKLKSIDKAIYRKHLNIVIACSVAGLLVFALGVSSILIHFLGDKDSSNFVLNLIGVVFAAFSVAGILYRVRDIPFMSEVVYVWYLKQELNFIYRHSAKLTPAIESNHHNALIISYFNLQGSIQLYELDDNDLTLDSLKIELTSLKEKIDSLGLTISSHDYRRDLLNSLDDDLS